MSTLERNALSAVSHENLETRSAVVKGAVGVEESSDLLVTFGLMFAARMSGTMFVNGCNGLHGDTMNLLAVAQ